MKNSCYFRELKTGDIFQLKGFNDRYYVLLEKFSSHFNNNRLNGDYLRFDTIKNIIEESSCSWKKIYILIA